MDDGDLPSLKIPFRTPAVNLYPVAPGEGREVVVTEQEEPTAVITPPKPKKSKWKIPGIRPKSQSPSPPPSPPNPTTPEPTYVVNESTPQLSPSTRLKHRAFWTQLERDGSVDPSPLKAVISPEDPVESEEDAPNDELAFIRSRTSIGACGAGVGACGMGATGGEEGRRERTVEDEIEEEDQSENGGILGVVMDLCNDCSWVVGGDPASTKRKARNTSYPKKNRREDVDTDIDDDMSEEEEEDGSSQGGSLEPPSPLRKPRKKSNRRSNNRHQAHPQAAPVRPMDDDEYTEIEVEYAGDGAHDPSTPSTEEEESPLQGNGDGTASSLRSPNQNFVQLANGGDVTNVQPSSNNNTDTPSSPTTNDPNSNGNNSPKAWSNDEKTKYLRAMAHKAKSDFRRTKGIEDEAQHQTLRDAVAKGSALAQTHSECEDDSEKDDGSLEGILDETQQQHRRDGSMDDWAPAEKRRFVQLVRGDRGMGPEEAKRVIMASRRASPQTALGEMDEEGNVKDLSQIRSNEFDRIVASMVQSTSRSYPFQPIDDDEEGEEGGDDRDAEGFIAADSAPVRLEPSRLEQHSKSRELPTNNNHKDPREVQSDVGYSNNIKSTSFLNGASILANMRKKPGFTRVVEGRGLDDDALEEEGTSSNPGKSTNWLEGRGLGIGGANLGDDFDREVVVEERARSSPGAARGVPI